MLSSRTSRQTSAATAFSITAISKAMRDDLLPVIGAEGDIPNDNVMALATTYVRNLTGDNLAIGGCAATDDSVAVWVNNKNVHVNSIPRGGNDNACAQDTFRLILPPGVSKIAVGTWEGGGGFDMSFALTDLAGNKLADGNEFVEFMGHGVGNDEAVTQIQYCADRTIDLPLSCPRQIGEAIPFTIDGSEGIGDPADEVTICETFTGSVDAAAINITAEGAVIEDDVRQFGNGINGAGFVTDLLFLGPMANEAGAGPSAEQLQENHILSTSDASIDSSDPNYNPVAGDTVPANVLAIVDNPAGDAINPEGVLRWNLVQNPNFNFNDYYGGDVDFNLVCVAFYFTLPEARDDVHFGIGSDDSYSIRVDGTVVGFRSIPRGCGGANSILDNDGPHSFAAGEHFAIVTYYEGGGGHCGRVGLFDADRNPLQQVSYGVAPGENSGLADPFVASRKVTITTTREAVNAGLNYSVSSDVAQNISVSGSLLPDGVPVLGASRAAVVDPPTAPFDGTHDIGNQVAIAGFTQDNGDGSYTLQGQGPDIWNGGDHFHFAYKRVTGDFDAKVRIAERRAPISGSRWGKHGLMARWTCDQGSSHSFVQTSLASPDQDIDTPRYHLRPAGQHLNDGGSQEREFPDGYFADRQPEWFRLVRVGPTVYGYYSEDGERWLLAGADTQLSRPETLLVGIALTSHGPGAAQIDFDNWTLESLDLAATTSFGPGSTPLIEPIDYAGIADGEAPPDAVVVDNNAADFSPAVVGERLRVTEDRRQQPGSQRLVLGS